MNKKLENMAPCASRHCVAKFWQSALWHSRMSGRNTKLYISGLGPTVQQKELYELLARHGKIISLSVKNNYAFVEFSHPDDADDAIRGLDGLVYHGKKLMVQVALPKGKQGSPSRDPLSPYSRTRIYVGGLTEGINMRELEDVFSEVGHVVRTVDKKSFAFLEYETSLAADKAIKRFNGTDFMGRRLIVNFATIPFHSRAPGHHSPRRGRSRSLSRSPSRGRKRLRYSSLSRSRSRSRSLSRSPLRGYSRSRSRSRDRGGWDRGRDRGRDRRRGRSRDYSPYFRSWSRSTSGSSSDSSRSRSRSRSLSKSPLSSHSSASPLNSPPVRNPNSTSTSSTHITANGHSKTEPHTPSDSSSLPSSSSDQVQPIISSPPSYDASSSLEPKTTDSQPPSSVASPTPSTPQDIMMSDSIKSESTVIDTASAQPIEVEIETPTVNSFYPSSQSPTLTQTPLSSSSGNPSSPSQSIAPSSSHTTSYTIPASPTAPVSTSTPSTSQHPITSPSSSLASSAEIEQRSANFETKETDKEKEKEKEKDYRDKELDTRDRDRDRDNRDPYARGGDRDRERDRDYRDYRDRDYRDRERDRDYRTTRRYPDRRFDYPSSSSSSSSSSYYPSSSSSSSMFDQRKPEREATHSSTVESDESQKDLDTTRANGNVAPLSSTPTPAPPTSTPTSTPTITSIPTPAPTPIPTPTTSSTTITSVDTPVSSAVSSAPQSGSKDALEQVLSNLYKTRDSMMKGIDGVFGELQRRNQLFSQLISREEGRNKELDGLRTELTSVKKDLVAKQDMSCRRIESELERRLAILERKVVKAPEDESKKGMMSQEAFMSSLNSSLTPLCASLDATFKMIADTRSEQQVLKNEMRLVLDALRADVHGSREAVMVKVDNTINDLRGPMGQLVASETQNARLIDSLRAQLDGLRSQVANVAQTQQTQAQAQAQQAQEPPSFAGHKKMFPIEGLTSKDGRIKVDKHKIFSIDQKIETLENNLTKQFSELKNEILTQQAIRGMITEDKKNARTTRKKGSGSAV